MVWYGKKFYSTKEFSWKLEASCEKNRSTLLRKQLSIYKKTTKTREVCLGFSPQQNLPKSSLSTFGKQSRMVIWNKSRNWSVWVWMSIRRMTSYEIIANVLCATVLVWVSHSAHFVPFVSSGLFIRDGHRWTWQHGRDIKILLNCWSREVQMWMHRMSVYVSVGIYLIYFMILWDLEYNYLS